MVNEDIDTVIRQAIGGDHAAMAWITGHADTTVDAVVLTMAGLLQQRPEHLDRAAEIAETSRDRQVVAIARAHLERMSELVDALARDHLVDFPDSLIVAWIASDPMPRTFPTEPA